MVPEDDISDLTGDELLAVLSALASPHRLRLVGMVAAGRKYVSQLARDLEMSRPLVHMHLKRLESAGLVTGQLELSEEGRAMKYFEPAPFLLRLTPETIAVSVQSLSSGASDTSEKEESQ